MAEDERQVAWSGIETLLNAAKAQLNDQQVNSYLNDVAERSGHNIREARMWYPLAVYEQMLTLLGQRCFPGFKEREQAYNLGLAAFEAYRQTTIGRVTTSAISAIGPYKTLERICKQLSQTFSGSTCKINQSVPHHYSLLINGPHPHPAYLEGYLRSILNASGAQQLIIAAGPNAPEQGSFDISWS